MARETVKAVLVDSQTNRVHQVILDPNPEQYPENGTIGDYTIIYNTDLLDFWGSNPLDTCYWDPSEQVFKSAPNIPMKVFNWQTKEYEDIPDPATSIDPSRKMLLFDSDWTQLPDSPLTDSKKAEWATYRQALRDLPSSNTTPIDWPLPPA